MTSDELDNFIDTIPRSPNTRLFWRYDRFTGKLLMALNDWSHKFYLLDYYDFVDNSDVHDEAFQLLSLLKDLATWTGENSELDTKEMINYLSKRVREFERIREISGDF